MVPVGSLINALCKAVIHGENGLIQRSIAQQAASIINQPRAFNIMPVTVQINQAVVVQIKEYFLPVAFRIEYFFLVNLQDGTHCLSDPFVLGCPIKAAVCLKDVQQGIHRAACHNAIFRQLFVRGWFPVSVECFQIACSIKCLFLNQIKQLIRQLFRIRILGQAIVRR